MTDGTGAAEFSAFGVAPVTTGAAYFGAAEQFMFGARALSAHNGAFAFTLVCGQVAECLLKAFLSWKGESDASLKKTGHDLSELRTMALAHGLAVAPNEPQWFSELDALHGAPYRLRYPMGVHATVLPAMPLVLSELEALLELVRAARA